MLPSPLSLILGALLMGVFPGCAPELEGDLSSDVVDGVSAQAERVFVTSQKFAGNPGGTSGMDAYCASAASAAGLKRTYRALVSSATVSVRDRFQSSRAVYLVRAGDSPVKIADSVSALWSGSIAAPISRDEFGAAPDSSGQTDVWTGSDDEFGGGIMNNCNGWTGGGFCGVGQFINADESWVSGGALVHSITSRVYCLSSDI